MSIDPARLRSLDMLRIFETLAENPALEWILDELRDQYGEMALRADTADLREAARQKYLAVDDVRAALVARMAGYRLSHEQEMAAEREAAAKQEAA
jgi:hypothetical protein